MRGCFYPWTSSSEQQFGLFLQMEMMEKPVGRGSEKEPDICYESYPAEDGIGR